MCLIFVSFQNIISAIKFSVGLVYRISYNILSAYAKFLVNKFGACRHFFFFWLKNWKNMRAHLIKYKKVEKKNYRKEHHDIFGIQRSGSSLNKLPSLRKKKTFICLFYLNTYLTRGAW